MLIIVILTSCNDQEPSIVDPSSKIQDRLWNYVTSNETEYPDYLVNEDGTYNIIILCHENIHVDECKGRIEKYGLITRHRWENVFDVSINPNNIIPLANEPLIKYIEEGNFPTGLDPITDNEVLPIEN
ncbi:MAG: hypothetical protein KJ709_02530 [Nanoarchaeota archaeon]|nr:hypothetical protein [Nanoarchaeota archaeon]